MNKYSGDVCYVCDTVTVKERKKLKKMSNDSGVNNKPDTLAGYRKIHLKTLYTTMTIKSSQTSVLHLAKRF